MNDPQDLLAQRARATLDASVDALDAATLSRLNRARQHALAAATRPRRAPRAAWTAAFATIAALGVAWLLVPGTDLPGAAPPTTASNGAMTIASPLALDDSDVIAAGDNLEMYEDLEFYAWLDTQQQEG